MSRLIGYVKDYFLSLNWKSFLFISLILSVLIIINYQYGLGSWVLNSYSFPVKFARASVLYLVLFIGTYVLQKGPMPRERLFYILLIIAPLIFAAKAALMTKDVFPSTNQYWRVVLQWPLKSLIVLLSLLIIGTVGGYRWPLFGTRLKGANLQPYFILLLLMVPLLLIAGAGADFQRVYPKLQLVSSINDSSFKWFKIILFELFYGIDFFTIELFFRGFLILAFIKYVGKDAILPMAVFYCAIHFGKPLAECISSYFGGLILGAIVYNTRSIWGGLVVHLGIAWMMEIIGATIK